MVEMVMACIARPHRTHHAPPNRLDDLRHHTPRNAWADDEDVDGSLTELSVESLAHELRAAPGEASVDARARAACFITRVAARSRLACIPVAA